MKLTKFIAKVRTHELLVSKFQYIDFELVRPSRIEFEAGQYLMMKVPGVEQRKTYTIASLPAQNHSIEILVDVSPGGEGSLFLASLKPGDEVELMAPGGKFVVADTKEKLGLEEKKLLFVATGSGISAVRSQILDLLQTKKDKREIYLHWGLRYAEDVFWEEDFRELTEFFDNFHFDLVLSKPPTKWPFCSGYVTHCVAEHHSDFSDMGIYLCGNGKMIVDINTLLSEKGVSKEHIHMEKFFE